MVLFDKLDHSAEHQALNTVSPKSCCDGTSLRSFDQRKPNIYFRSPASPPPERPTPRLLPWMNPTSCILSSTPYVLTSSSLVWWTRYWSSLMTDLRPREREPTTKFVDSEEVCAETRIRSNTRVSCEYHWWRISLLRHYVLWNIFCATTCCK